MTTTAKPLRDGYFILAESDGEPPRLLGSYSPQAGLTFYPRRRRCPVTEGPVEDVELSTEGELYAWTYVEAPMMGKQTFPLAGLDAAAGYGVGQVDLPEGVRIQSVIGGRLGDWRIGMRMRAAVLPLFEDETGTTRCTFYFLPVTEEPA